MLVVQGNAFNRSRVRTVVVVPLTTNLARAEAPGNVHIAARVSRLPADSIANVSLVTTIDRGLLVAHVGGLPHDVVAQVLAGIDLVLGR